MTLGLARVGAIGSTDMKGLRIRMTTSTALVEKADVIRAPGVRKDLLKKIGTHKAEPPRG